MSSVRWITAALLAPLAIGLAGRSSMLQAQDTTRGVGVRSARDTAGLGSGKYHALLIAVADYADRGLQRLNAPLKDAERLRTVLTTRYKFEPGDVTLLANPNREKILDALHRVSEELGSNDNLLIFYAGHGSWDEGSRQSFWLPTDARLTSQANWISNDDIGRYLRRMKTRHTLLIADACFAGAMLLREASSEAALARLYALPSRKAMTSGSKEVVPDRSVFLDYFIQRLDTNSVAYLSAGSLFASLRDAVMNNSTLLPQFGTIFDVGDQGGDFLFPTRSPGSSAPTASVNRERGKEQYVNRPDERGEARTPLAIVEGKNHDLVDLISKKDHETLAGYYRSEPSTPPDWREKLLLFVRSDLTKARMVAQETLIGQNEAASSVEVSVEYRDPVVAGNRTGTLHILVRHARLGSDWSLKSYSLTRKPPP